MRKLVLLASTIVAVSAAIALPTRAIATTATFTLTAGALSISTPAGPVALGAPQVASTSARTFSGPLGTVTVTDERGGATTWVTSVISTAFTPVPASTAVAAVNVAYAAGTVTQSALVTAATPVTTDLTGVSPVVNGTSTGLSTASWNPTITVVVPANAAPGVYSGTITHSVA
jgi:hypothetical protein